MADFRNKKIRMFFDSELANASAEDVALLIAALQPVLTSALDRIKALSTAQGVSLDPLPVKSAAAVAQKADE